MIITSIITATVAGGLALGMPAHTAAASCTTERTLVSAAVPGTAAVYGERPLILPAEDPWIERILVSDAVEEVSHVVHHEAVYAERIVIDQPYIAPTPAVEEVSHLVHHDAVTDPYDETIVLQEAWDEKVVDVEAQPGTPGQEEISHVEYDLVSEAWDEKIVDVEAQDAVWLEFEYPGNPDIYGDPELIAAAVPAKDAVYTDIETCAAVSPDAPVLAHEPYVAAQGSGSLAETGTELPVAIPVGAGALLVAGGLIALFARRRRPVRTED
jgi:hypothetical protein